MSSAEQLDGSSDAVITIKLTHHGTAHSFGLPADADLAALNEAVTDRLGIPASNQKFMISPKTGLLKPPYKDSKLPLSTLQDKKIQLLAPLPSDLASLQRPEPRVQKLKTAKPARTIDHARTHADITYTFHKIVPLSYLPNPARSTKFLERLRDDPGIKAAMRQHKFTVGVLTEMDPAMHTTHESKTLGLNRNRGEVIELRLRTDAYDGYRDYKTIRKTLCHELAHNVWGEHDRNFWNLTGQIEKEVEKADWTRGGKSVGEEEFYNPDDGGYNHIDGGGWTGGEFMLGGVGGPSQAGSSSGLTRRELMAQAAEERLKRQKEVGKKPSSEEPET